MWVTMSPIELSWTAKKENDHVRRGNMGQYDWLKRRCCCCWCSGSSTWPMINCFDVVLLIVLMWLIDYCANDWCSCRCSGSTTEQPWRFFLAPVSLGWLSNTLEILLIVRYMWSDEDYMIMYYCKISQNHEWPVSILAIPTIVLLLKL